MACGNLAAVPAPSAHPSRWKSWASTGCVVVAAVALLIAVLAGWATRTLFDSREFATRSVAALDSAAVRHALAAELTDEIIAVGPPTLESYRPVLTQAVEVLVATDAFRSVFRVAVEEAHQAAVDRQADRGVLELGETLSILASSTEDASPGLAQSLPGDVSSVLIDVNPILTRLHPWLIAERVRWLDEAAAVVAVAAMVGAVVLARRRRAVVRRLGLMVAGVGLVVVFVTLAVPDVLAAQVSDAALVAATRAGLTRFVGDLAAAGMWLVVVGVLVAAATTAAGPPRLVRDVGGVGGRWRQMALGGFGPARQAGVGAALIGIGGVLVVDPAGTLRLFVVVVGASAAYVGLVAVLTAALGPVVAIDSSDERLGDPAGRARRWTRRSVLVAAGLGALVLVASVLARGAMGHAGSEARASGEVKCNGHASLCDRRLDQVAFAGSHNSMSAASDPGWLFAEQLTGIPAQLDSGVRALLVKTHYGIPTGVTVDGAELVVTAKAAESANSPIDEAAELGTEAVARATALAATVPKDGSKRDVYLCHVYCELGATRFSDTLRQMRHFLDQNPHEVVMLFIGDCVSAGSTSEAFDKSGLTDRLWTYDTTQPPPTLREMIDAHRNLLVLTEHSGPPPSWYTKGYGIFQDTPFTFASPAQFSCAANRGPADAPLFEINHFITNASPPSAKEAVTVNSTRALTDRIATCRRERNLFPTIVAVDFVAVGDLMGVIDQVNGVSSSSARR